MRINDLMTHPVVSCPDDSTADVAARLMWEFDCGTVVVTDHDGRLAGMITDRDLTMAALSQGRSLYDIKLSSAMARDVAACHEGDTVEAVENVMRTSQVRRVPVVDDDRRPVGIVALNDLARLADRSRKHAVDREVVQTLAAVSQPRTGTLSAARIPRPLVD
jgi:CBS domain-containing protein